MPFTIPGERVRVRLAPRARADGVVPAELLEVVRPSPHRIAPGCPHFGPQGDGLEPCGGCAWQHIAYGEQLRIKTDLVTRLVRAAAPPAPAAHLMLAATPLDAPWGYRHKIHFVFGSTGGRRPRLLMGHYARGSRRTIDVYQCPVHAEAGNMRAFALRDACVKSGVQAATPAGSPDAGV